ncbi:hypothetical protein MIR68_010101 [Amoeboaphelidium protococcarum]|nr:hypothetical protein MIR68_010101 [Amoeboaphelidium protococcarum]
MKTSLYIAALLSVLAVSINALPQRGGFGGESQSGMMSEYDGVSQYGMQSSLPEFDGDDDYGMDTAVEEDDIQDQGDDYEESGADMSNEYGHEAKGRNLFGDDGEEDYADAEQYGGEEEDAQEYGAQEYGADEEDLGAGLYDEQEFGQTEAGDMDSEYGSNGYGADEEY